MESWLTQVPGAKKCGRHLEAREWKEVDSPLEALEGTQLCGPILNFLSIGENKFVLLSTTKFVGEICYNSKGNSCIQEWTLAWVALSQCPMCVSTPVSASLRKDNSEAPVLYHTQFPHRSKLLSLLSQLTWEHGPVVFFLALYHFSTSLLKISRISS